MGIRHSHSRNSGYRLPLFQTLADVWVYTLNVRPIPIYYEENVYHLPRNFAQHIAYYAAHPSPAFHLQGRPLRNGTRRPRIHIANARLQRDGYRTNQRNVSAESQQAEERITLSCLKPFRKDFSRGTSGNTKLTRSTRFAHVLCGDICSNPNDGMNVNTYHYGSRENLLHRWRR